MYVGRVHEVVTGERGVTGGGILSLLILVALPVVDYALCRALAAAAVASKRADAESEPGFIASYEPVLRRAIHIVVVVAGLLWLADLWNLNVFAMANQSLGGRVASSLLGISLVLLLAYMLWEIAKTAIDRRLAAEREQPADSPSSRLRTLLPLLRVTLLITIAVMATLSVLAALGVDILPLLAGAGVVGVAVGFGSQTLVRDIVSGAFFLMDDAFRLGEYIEVGQAKGRIEKIAVRALFLRHHRGAINVLPYGEIKQLRNTSRDWMIMVMEFRLAFDTDLKKVKRILKQISGEIAADPELGPELLQPLNEAHAEAHHREPGQQVVVGRVDGDAATACRARAATSAEPDGDRQLRADPVGQPSRERRGEDDHERRGQEAHAGLERAVAEDVLHVERHEEEHRQHRERDDERDPVGAQEGAAAEEAELDHRVAARAARRRRRRRARRPPAASRARTRGEPQPQALPSTRASTSAPRPTVSAATPA